MMGREVSLAIDIMMGTFQDTEKVKKPEYVETSQNQICTCFEQLRMQSKKNGERQRKYYKLSKHRIEYKPGDLVYL